MFRSRRFPYSYFLLFSPVGALVAAFSSNTLIIAEGESMQPTINPPGTECELLFVDVFSPVRSGDVVVVRNPQKLQEKLCKRITGMDGDVIVSSQSKDVVKVPLGQCWIEGDNASESSDSNYYGSVPLKNVIGSVKYTLFPNFRKIESVLDYHKTLTDSPYVKSSK